ncbi:type II toxin-antitoxin system prevent-host-death family antitoxin [Prosthecomicrobium hirschii]
MMKTISAADANRHFSKLMRDVAEGDAVIVTSHGRPVAKIVPLTEEDRERDEQVAAGRRLLERLEAQPVLGPLTWTRDELYDDEPYPESF